MWQSKTQVWQFKVECLGDLEFTIEGLGFRVLGLRFGWGLEFRVWTLGFRV